MEENMISAKDRIYDVLTHDKALDKVFKKHGIRCYG